MIGVRHLASHAYFVCLAWLLLSSFAVDAQQESVWQCNGQAGQLREYTKLGPPRESSVGGLSLLLCGR